MPGFRNFACAIGFACAASAASGQAPLQGENLLFSPPFNFKVGFQSDKNGRSMTEWVPRSETVEDWSQMLTVQIFRGATVEAPAFLQKLAEGYMGACPGTTARGIFTGKINGYVVSMLVLKCPKNPETGKPETTAFRLIKGNDALYGVQRAWRSLASDQEISNVMHELARVTVCDTRSADHPCPDLTPVVPAK